MSENAELQIILLCITEERDVTVVIQIFPDIYIICLRQNQLQ